MKFIPVLFVFLALVAGCASDDEPAASDPTSTSASASIPASTEPGITETTSSVASFDPLDAEWVIQQDGAIVVVGADGIGSFSPTAEVSGFDENNPDWSPDGSQLSFIVVDGSDDLWVVGVDGVGARKLYDCESPCRLLDDPAWSPDGSSIAACKLTNSDDGYLGSLVGIDVETGDEVTLATLAPEDVCSGARWSPDGTEISLELVHRTGTSLIDEVVGVTLTIVNLSADPLAIRPLTDPALFASWGNWNPAGDLIVYSALPTPDAAAAELFTVQPDGSDIRQLTNVASEGGSAIEPIFDLDGSSVVFVDEVAGSLRRVDLATGAVTPAFTADISGAHPRPRPRP